MTKDDLEIESYPKNDGTHIIWSHIDSIAEEF